MARANVRGHTRDGNPVRSHTRHTQGARPSLFTPSPGRAGRNITRAVRAAKRHRKGAAAVLGGAAAGEIALYLTFKTAGGILMGTALLLGVVGGALWFSARR